MSSTLLAVTCLLLAAVTLIAVLWAGRAARHFRHERGELEALIRQTREELMQSAHAEALAKLERWKVEHEAEIRRDAVARSQSVVIGKVSEHLLPYVAEFPFNPRDARFIGSPIDIVVFDGADDGCIEQVVFLEIKTSTSALNARQKQVRQAVESGRVAWREMRV